MELTPEIRSKIVKHESFMDSDKSEKYRCPMGVYFVFTWKDKDGNTWSSEAYPNHTDNEKAVNHFWKLVCDNI